MNSTTYTGNIRYRVSWLGKVILQVEVEWPDGPDDSNGMPICLRGRGYRDAIPEDLQYFILP